MAEKELKVKVTTETDISSLEDLGTILNEATSKGEDLNKILGDITGNMDTSNVEELENELAEATAEVERLEDALSEAELNGDDIEADIIADELAFATEEAERLQTALDSITNDIDSTGVDELDSSLENASNSADSLNDSLSNLDSSSLDDASTSADELNDSLSGIDGTSLDDASGSADNLAGSLDDASGSADSLNGALESASYMSMAEGVGQYADGAENLAQSMNEASISVGQLATQAGIAEPQMVALINNISNATFPQQEAMQYVQALDQMGVSADKLGDSATNMDRINDAFGIGSSQVVQLTNNLGVLGVSADNLPASFNALAYAQSNVTGGVDRFNTILQRLGPTFSEYGYNVDQAAVITAAATQKWGTGRKSMTELSNAMKECGGDTAALEQALGLQAGALSNASDITGQYSGQLQDLADEEAEHKTWLDHINAAWEDMSLALSPVLSPLMSVIGLIGQFGQFALAINSIATLAETFGILETANLALIPSQIAEGVAGWFSVGWMILAVAIILAVIAAFVYLYSTNEDFRAFIDGLIGGFMDFCGVVYNDVIGALEWLQGAFQNTVSFLQTYGELFVEAFFVMTTGGIGAIVLLLANMNGMPNKLGAILQSAINQVISFAGSFASNLWRAATTAVSRFASGIGKLKQAFKDEIDKIISDAQNFVGRIGQIMWNAAVNAWKNFLNGLDRHSPGIMSREFTAEMLGIIRTAKDAEDPLASSMRQLGISAVDAWSNPNFDYSITGNMGIDMDNVDVNGRDNVEGLLNRILDVLTNLQGGYGSLTFNLYGDMDSEDRMEKFLNAVRRDLEWDNNTAGRGV